jgi:hypothetical protein
MIDGDIISVICLELLTLKPVKTLRMHYLYSTRSRSLGLVKTAGFHLPRLALLAPSAYQLATKTARYLMTVCSVL